MIRENNHPQNSTPLFSLDVYTKSQISSTAKTAGIAAILSITGTIVSVVAYFLKPTPAKQFAKEGFDDNTIKLATTGNLFFVVISLVINLIMFYTLFSFSRSANKGIAHNDSLLFNKGLTSLATYFKIIAVLMILVSGIIFIATLMTLLGASI